MHPHVAALVLLPALMLAQEQAVQRSAISIGTVKRGNLVRTVRGLGEIVTTRTAELQVPEPQAREIAIGQTVVVETQGGIASARVSRKDPAVARAVRVELRLDGDAPRGADPGTVVDGTIYVSRLKDVVYVAIPHGGQPESTQAIFRLEGNPQEAVRLQVGLGLTAFSTVDRGGAELPAELVIEIRSGLQPGDQVILSDMSLFKDVARVRLQ